MTNDWCIFLLVNDDVEQYFYHSNYQIEMYFLDTGGIGMG